MKKYLFPLLVVFAVVLIVGCGKLANVPGQVNPPAGSLISIIVSPESTAIAVSSTQQFSASGVMSSSTVSITPTWEVIGGVGTIDATGLFTATSVGVGTVEARIGEVVGRAVVEVSAKTVHGYVYSINASNIYTGDLVPIQGVDVIIGDKNTMTDVNGYFAISGITDYQTTITARKDLCSTRVIVSEKDNVKFYLYQMGISMSRTYTSGPATIEGVVSGDTGMYIDNLAYYYDEDKIVGGIYNSSSHSYVINNAPDHGEVYIGVKYSTNEASRYKEYFTYKRENINPGRNEINLDIGNNIVNGHIIVPAGYKPMYVRGYLFRNKRAIYFQLSFQDSLNGVADYLCGHLPALQAGDSFTMSMIAGKEESASSPLAPIEKILYNVNGTVNIDIGSAPKIIIITPTPAEGSIVTGQVKIAWEPVLLQNVNYWVRVYGAGVNFQADTSDNSFTIPNCMQMEAGSTYNVTIYAISAPSYNAEDFASLLNNYDVDIAITSDTRSFIYGGSSTAAKYATISSAKLAKQPTRCRSIIEQLLWPGLSDN